MDTRTGFTQLPGELTLSPWPCSHLYHIHLFPHTLSCTSPHKQYAKHTCYLVTQAHFARVTKVQTKGNTGGKTLTKFYNIHQHIAHGGGREARLHSSLKQYKPLPQTRPFHSPHPTTIGWHNEMCVCHTST